MRIWTRRTRRTFGAFLKRAAYLIFGTGIVVYVSLNFLPFAEWLDSLHF